MPGFPRVRALWIVALATLVGLSAFVPAIHAQQPTPPADDLAQLSAEALVERATRQVEQVEAVRKRLDELAARVAAAAKDTAELAAARTAFELPDAADPTPQRDEEAARATLTAWTTRSEALQRLARIVSDLAAAETKHRELLLQASNDARLLAETAQPLVAIRKEAQKRIDAGDLAADKLPEWLRANDPTAKVTEWRTRADDRRDAAVRSAAAVAEATKAGGDLQTQIAAASNAQQLAGAYLQEANRRAELRKELGANDAASLVALLGTRLAEVREADTKLTADATAIAEGRAEIRTLDEQLAARTPPDPASIEVQHEDGDPGSLRDARKAWRVAQAMEKFHQKTLELLTGLQTRVKTLSETAVATSTGATDLLQKAIAVDVIARMVQQRIEAGDSVTAPEGATPDATDKLVQEIRERVGTVTATVAALAMRAEQVAARVEATTKAVEEGATNTEARRAALERETRWASFIAGVQNLDTPALVTRFSETMKAIAEATAKIDKLDAARKAAAAAVEAEEKGVATDTDPVVLAEIGKRNRFVEWARSKSLEVPEDTRPDASAGGESRPAAGAETGAPRNEMPNSSPALPTPGAEPPAAEITEKRIRATLELRDQTVARRLGYFRDRAERREKLIAAVTARIQAVTAHRDAVAEALELARRAWACANTLDVRAANGQIASADLPAEAANWRSRDAVAGFQKTVDELTAQITKSTARLDTLQATNPAEPFIEPLAARYQNLTKQIEKLRERQELEAAYPTPDPASLTELEQKKAEHECEQRMSTDTGFWEQVVGVFGGDKADDIDALLREYYTRLLEFERQATNLDRRATITQSIEGLVDGTRESLELIGTQVEARLKAAEHDLEIATVRVKYVVRQDDATIRRAAELGIDTTALEKLPAGADEARAMRAKLLNSLVGPWARVSGYQQWRSEIQTALAELGGIDAEIGRLKDIVAALEAARHDHRRRMQRLTGRPSAELAQMPADEQPKGIERDRFLLGEIGLLRQERISRLNWAAGQNAIWLILIPFFAWLAIRGASLIGNRLIARVSTEPIDGAPPTDRKSAMEREERARTLFHVFRAGWTIIVVILAAIYMLKAISVDVTPLLASAGIFGLAIAFGAQPLMRDFFAGFFILLENQYNLHDIVTINGITGTIERITLRLTIVRDIEGKVHYIPNGSIDMVTNQTKRWSRIKMDVGASYNDHPDKVMDCLKGIGEELKADPTIGFEVLEFEVPGLETFADSSINYRVHIKVIAGSQWKIAREFRRRVKLAFDRDGIEIPFPQRVVHHIRDDDAAAAAPDEK